MKQILHRVCFSAAACLVLAVSALTAFAEETGTTVAEVTFDSGGLKLTQASKFSFGSQTVSLEAKSYPALEKTITINITDLRGNRDGWNLTAVVNPFTLVGGDGSDTLPGAMIYMNNGTASGGLGEAPVINDTIRLDTDAEAGSERIADAAQYTAYGSWDMSWSGGAGAVNEDVLLYIPGLAGMQGTHQTTIDWTLEDTP